MSLVIPDHSLLMPHQLEVMENNPARFKVLVWHRRARKTTTAIEETRKQSYLRKGIYYGILPLRKQAKDNIWKDPDMLFRIFHKEEIKKVNESELTLYLQNGSIFMLHGADHPESLKGGNPIGGFSDEFDTMKIETWHEVLYPILNNNGGWWWFTGTPKGKRNLYPMLVKAQQGAKNWAGWHLRGDKSGILTSEQLEEARLTMTEAMYRQEILCEFLDDEGTVFRNIRGSATATPKDVEDGSVYVMGVDLAKYEDWTVVSVVDRTTNEEVYRDRFQQLEWPFQRAKIKAISDKYLNALIVIDATGVGDPVVDDLMRMGLPVKPIKLTNTNKKEMIEKLSIWMQQGYFKFIPDENCILELENFSYEMLPSGRVRYTAPEGYHDDEVIAKALAVSELTQKVPVRKQKEPSSIQKLKARRLAQMNNENELDNMASW